MILYSRSFFNLKSRIFRSFSTLKPIINLKEILEDIEKLKVNVLERRMNVNIESLKELNEKRIELTKELNILNGKRKLLQNGHQSARTGRKEIMKELKNIEDKLLIEISTLPNWSSKESPIGENKIILQYPNDFDPNTVIRSDHVDICKKFDLVDFERPALCSGSHFFALKGIAALLEMALISWSINRATQRGFIPISVPDCIKEKFVIGCGFIPRRGKIPIYTINEPDKCNEDPLVLSGTSEIFLASQYAGQTILGDRLPLKFVGVSHCFRSEVGHHTAQSRGLYRVHQFTKVELFTFSEGKEEAANEHFKEITELQASLLKELNLPYRVLEMARWELGASAHRKWDHEVWMPGRKIWGEVMSTSNCTDFQSRRLAIRQKSSKGDLTFPYTLNGTACAVPRIVMALLEWGWNEKEGKERYLSLPKVLEPFYPSNERTYGELKIRFID